MIGLLLIIEVMPCNFTMRFKLGVGSAIAVAIAKKDPLDILFDTEYILYKLYCFNEYAQMHSNCTFLHASFI